MQNPPTNAPSYFPGAPESSEWITMETYALGLLLDCITQKRYITRPVDLASIAAGHPSWPNTPGSPLGTWWAQYGRQSFELAVSVAVVRRLGELSVSGFALRLITGTLVRSNLPSLLLKMLGSNLQACPPFDLNTTFFVTMYYFAVQKGSQSLHDWVAEELHDIIEELTAKAVQIDAARIPQTVALPPAFMQMSQYWQQQNNGPPNTNGAELPVRPVRGLPKTGTFAQPRTDGHRGQ
ncbi:hypothetical protein DFH06DRAFT_1477833 [Mycena polygramma]|nr:hypothetical protein DFH06DRAFT_1477833 [Mycena polygramma]